MNRLRLGIVGCGWVATHRHVPAIRRSGMGDIVAVHDRRSDRAQSLAARVGAEAFSGPLEEMLTREKPDVVWICTPPWLHADQAITALERGIHVLTEKPMAMTAAECVAMCDTARRSGLKLSVAHNFLFSRAFREVQRRIASGRSGEIHATVGMQMSTPRRRLPDWYATLPGQLFFDEAPHLAYLTRRFIGPPEPNVEFADATEAPLEAVQRTQSVVSVLRGGSRVGLLSMNFNASRAEWAFGIVGSRESYFVDLFRDQLLVAEQGGSHGAGEVIGQTLGALLQLTSGAIRSGLLYSSRSLLWGHEILDAAFLHAVLADTDPPVSGEDGTATIGVLERISRLAGLYSVAEKPV